MLKLRKLLISKRSPIATSFESNNIFYAVYPFYQFCKICALCPLLLQNINGKLHLKFSLKILIYSFVIFLAYGGGFFYGVQMLDQKSVKVSKSTIISYVTAWAQVYSVFSVAVIDILSSWTKPARVAALFELIQQIDSSIIDKIGTTLKYKKHLRYLCLQVTALSLIPFCFSMVNCAIILNVRYFPFTSCFWFICFAPIFIVTLKEFQFYNLMLLLKSKLTIINEELKNIDSGDFSSFKLCQSNKDSEMQYLLRNQENCEKISRYLTDLARLHIHVTSAAKIVLDMFSIHLLLLTSTALGVVTVQIYNLYAFIAGYLIIDYFSIFSIVIWIGLHFGVILVNVTVCNMFAKVMSDTGPLLHNIQNIAENRLLFQTAQMFSLQIMHRNVNFTAGGFFNLDYKLITSIVATVTTYFVIIIQFHIANAHNMNLMSFGNKTISQDST